MHLSVSIDGAIKHVRVLFLIISTLRLYVI